MICCTRLVEIFKGIAEPRRRHVFFLEIGIIIVLEYFVALTFLTIFFLSQLFNQEDVMGDQHSSFEKH